MRKADVQRGRTYAMKVSGRLSVVRVDSITDNGGDVLVGVTNLRTNRRLILRSARRLQFEVEAVPGSTLRYRKVVA